MLRRDGLRVVAHRATDPNVNLGVNNRADLALVDGRGPPPDPRAPHARRGDDRRPGLDLDRRRGRDRRRRDDRAGHRAARRDPDRRRLDHRPALDPDRHHGRRAVARPPLLPRPTPTSATSPPSARSPTCGPAPSSPRAPRPAAFVEIKNSRDRRGRQGPAPRLRRRRRGRRRRQRRRRHDHRQLRRPQEEPDEDRGRCANLRQHLARRAGHRRRRRLHWRRRGDPRGRPGRRARGVEQRAAQHRGLRGAQGRARPTRTHGDDDE